MFNLSNLYGDEGGDAEVGGVIVATEMEVTLCDHLLKKIGGAKDGMSAAGYAAAYQKVNEVILQRSQYLQSDWEWEEVQGEDEEFWS